MANQAFVNDQINFQLRADEVVVNDTVKVIVNVNALVNGETTESALRTEIKRALSSFIEAEWQISGTVREVDESGYEKVSLRATARVSEKENYNLDARTKAVSRKGLQLGQVEVDSTIPAPMLEAAEKRLRAQILKDAYEEAAELSKVSGVDYRVASVNFQNNGDPVNRKVAFATTANATYGSGFGGSAGGGDDEESLSNAQKISLSAQIQLGRIVLVP